ncbi:MAG: NeuD/PglB/VioB family sugar acetyltransferase [Eubacteriales bacterium]|nr:NeuD/PglB/VioB family sugar acetyltransferase [Eubacteriales bacterium]
MKKLVLYGAGGFAREVAFMIERINKVEPRYDLLGFVVDEQYYMPGMKVFNYPVIGTGEWLLDHKDEVVCTCVVGEPPEARECIQEKYEALGVKFETLVSPDVEVHKTVKIGEGSIICRGTMFTVDISIGKGTIINQRGGIGHDAKIGNYCCIFSACNVTGHVKIGNRVKVGGRAYFCPKVKVGDDAVIAAGSVVFTNVKAGRHVMGNPAKKIDL